MISYSLVVVVTLGSGEWPKLSQVLSYKEKSVSSVNLSFPMLLVLLSYQMERLLVDLSTEVLSFGRVT
jgi:hypothetical protein